jgi:RecB family exonuclease
LEAVRAGARQDVLADLTRYLEEEARAGCQWLPQEIELRFGFEDESEGESLPALELAEGDPPVRLRGMIDRVDVDPSGSGKAIVRDYKSGRRRDEYPVTRWASDRQLQVALYMIAVRELLSLDPVAGLYQPLRGDDLRPRGVYASDAPVGQRVSARDARDPEEIEEVLRDARERAVVIALALRSGELEPCPQTCSRDGCRHPGICRTAVT